MADHQQMSDEQRRILLITLVPLFMSLLSVSIVNVVLPAIGTSIEASNTALQWVLTGYTLTFGVVLVPAGRAGDLFGRGRLFVAGLVIFGLASLLAGLAPDPLVLNLARLLMGVGSGLLNPQVVGLIQQYFTGAARGRAFGLMGSIIGVSVAIGPTLGGLLIRFFGADYGWRSSFLINVPFVLLAIALAVVFFPPSAWKPPIWPSAAPPTPGEPRPQTAPEADGRGDGAVPEADAQADGAVPEADGAVPEVEGAASAGRRPADAAGGRGAGRDPRPDLDLVGVALLGAGTLCVLLPFLVGGFDPLFAGLGVLGLVLVIAWIVWENRYKRAEHAPMVDMDLFRTRTFANGALLISLYFFGVTSVWVVIAVYAQTGLGFTALQAGLIGLPAALCSAVSSAVAGQYVIRLGRPLVLIGMGLALFGLLASIGAVIMHDAHGWPFSLVVVAVSFIGVAQGMVISPNQTLALIDVPISYAGAAGGVLQTGQRIGTAMGLAVVTSVFFAVAASGSWTRAFTAAFGLIFVVVIAAAVIGVLDWQQGRRRPAATGE